MNLYGDDTGREKDILKNKAAVFVEAKKKKIKDIVSKEGQVGALELHSLAEEFAGGAEDENLDNLKKMLATALLERGYRLSSAVMRVEIRQEDLSLPKERAGISREETPAWPATDGNENEPDKRVRRKKRMRQSYSHRGLPSGDLE